MNFSHASRELMKYFARHSTPKIRVVRSRVEDTRSHEPSTINRKETDMVGILCRTYHALRIWWKYTWRKTRQRIDRLNSFDKFANRRREPPPEHPIFARCEPRNVPASVRRRHYDMTGFSCFSVWQVPRRNHRIIDCVKRQVGDTDLIKQGFA